MPSLFKHEQLSRHRAYQAQESREAAKSIRASCACGITHAAERSFKASVSCHCCSERYAVDVNVIVIGLHQSGNMHSFRSSHRRVSNCKPSAAPSHARLVQETETVMMQARHGHHWRA